MKKCLAIILAFAMMTTLLGSFAEDDAAEGFSADDGYETPLTDESVEELEEFDLVYEPEGAEDAGEVEEVPYYVYHMLEKVDPDDPTILIADPEVLTAESGAIVDVRALAIPQVLYPEFVGLPFSQATNQPALQVEILPDGVNVIELYYNVTLSFLVEDVAAPYTGEEAVGADQVSVVGQIEGIPVDFTYEPARGTEPGVYQGALNANAPVFYNPVSLIGGQLTIGQSEEIPPEVDETPEAENADPEAVTSEETEVGDEPDDSESVIDEETEVGDETGEIVDAEAAESKNGEAAETENGVVAEKAGDTEDAEAAEKDDETEDTEVVEEAAETENVEAVDEAGDTENVEAEEADETEDTEAAETENGEVAEKAGDTEDAEATEKDDKTEDTEVVEEAAETENVEAVDEAGDTENGEAEEADETEDTEVAETENGEAAEKAGDTEDAEAAEKDDETQDTEVVEEAADTDNGEAVDEAGDTENAETDEEADETEGGEAEEADETEGGEAGEEAGEDEEKVADETVKTETSTTVVKRNAKQSKGSDKTEEEETSDEESAEDEEEKDAAEAEESGSEEPGEADDALDEDILPDLYFNAGAFTVSVTPAVAQGPKGGKAIIIATVSGATGNVSYQWQASSDNGATWQNSGMSGNKTDTFRPDVKDNTLANLYRCKVTAGNGEGTSGTVRLQEGTAITVNVNPVTAKGPKGGKALVVATVTGVTGNVSYQWQASSDGGVTWQNSGMSGNKTDTFRPDVKDNTLANIYRCLVTADNGVGASRSVKLQEGTAITVNVNPVTAKGPKGGKALVVATVTGASGNVSYQWQASSDNGVTWQNSGMSGNKTDTFRPDVKDNTLANIYRCLVTADNGVGASRSVKLQEGTAITVDVNPVTAKGPKGGKTLVVATVTGASGNVSYQWQASSDNGVTWQNSGMSGNKTDTFRPDVKDNTLANIYRCLVTADNGVGASRSVKLQEGTAITVSVTPNTAKGPKGGKTVIIATVSGVSGNVSYQWQASSDNGVTWQNSGMFGNKTDTFRPDIKDNTLANIYRCKVTASNGVGVSKSVKLQEGVAFTVNVSPIVARGINGGKATIKATVSGATGTLTYQWQASSDGGVSWQNSGMSGNKTDTFKPDINENKTKNLYRCYVHASNGVGVSRSVSLVEVKATALPEESVVALGAQQTFTATVTGGTDSDTYTYQWETSSNGGSTWKNTGYTGNKTATLTLTANDNTLSSLYRCKVTTSYGTIYTNDVHMIEKSDFTFTKNSNGTYNVTGYTGTATSITIPSKYCGKSVVAIAANAFKGKNFTSVVIPTSVTSIGASAFENCASMTKVTLSDNVATIGAKAFKNCTKLANMAIKN